MAASSRTASRSTDISGVSAGGAGKKSGQRRGIEFDCVHEDGDIQSRRAREV